MADLMRDRRHTLLISGNRLRFEVDMAHGETRAGVPLRVEQPFILTPGPVAL